jgi:phage terminase Nu1 subunit (DNA packaging protein)
VKTRTPPPLDQGAEKRPGTIVAASAALGINRKTLEEWLRRGAPEKGRAGYDVAAIRAWKESRKKAPAIDWEWRLKREKARIARLDRRRRESELVDRQAALLCWAILARRLQQAGTALQKTFGPPAAKIINYAIEDCNREVASTFGGDRDAGPKKR